MILAGDIGGTKTNLAFFEEAGAPTPSLLESFPSREHGSLDEIVGQFVAAHGLRVERACFGVAGPVKSGRVETTNLPWVIDAEQLSDELGGAPVFVINDLEANAYGIAALGPADLCTLQPGAPGAAGNAAIIAAGTGLGEAGLYWDGVRHHPFACEGGHTEFSPDSDLEIELLRWLKQRWEHVSWERVVAGPGIHHLYEFLLTTGRGQQPAWLAEEMKAHDPSAAISHAAMEGKDPLCAEALGLFVALYGAEAGNLALKIMALGGLYVGGGIAPRILPKLKDGGFLRRFNAKGRMRPLMESMPVHVILNDKTALLGAARRAMLGVMRDA